VQIVGQWDALVLHLHLFFLKGCTFVGLWYGSKKTRKGSDFDICKKSVNADCVSMKCFSFTLLLFFLKGCTFVGL
jgi:hypothetical protein